MRDLKELQDRQENTSFLILLLLQEEVQISTIMHQVILAMKDTHHRHMAGTTGILPFLHRGHFMMLRRPLGFDILSPHHRQMGPIDFPIRRYAEMQVIADLI